MFNVNGTAREEAFFVTNEKSEKNQVYHPILPELQINPSFIYNQYIRRSQTHNAPLKPKDPALGSPTVNNSNTTHHKSQQTPILTKSTP